MDLLTWICKTGFVKHGFVKYRFVKHKLVKTGEVAGEGVLIRMDDTGGEGGRG